MDGATYALRAEIRRFSRDPRTRRCGVARVAKKAGVEVREMPNGREARWWGVMHCNKVHTCPVCSAAIRAERGELIRRAIEEGLREHAADVARAQREGAPAPPSVGAQMFTLTSKHDWSTHLDEQKRGMMKAWDRTRSSGSIARIFRARVRASVRAAEAKFSINGPHFHLHVLMLCEELNDVERAALRREWRKNVVRELGITALPSEEHGVWWSKRRTDSSCAAHYVTKLGLEMTHVAAKAAKGDARKGRTQWEVAHDAAKGCESSKKLWHHYERAMKGLRVINMDRRMAALAKRGKVAELPEPNEEDRAPRAVVFVPIEDSRLTFLSWLERWEPRALKLVLEAACAEGELTAEAVGARIDACIRWMVRVIHGAREGPDVVGHAGGPREDVRCAA